MTILLPALFLLTAVMALIAISAQRWHEAAIFGIAAIVLAIMAGNSLDPVGAGTARHIEGGMG